MGIDVRPLSPAVGALVSNVDLSTPLDDDTFARLQDAFFAHCVLVFPGQHLNPDDQF